MHNDTAAPPPPPPSAAAAAPSYYAGRTSEPNGIGSDIMIKDTNPVFQENVENQLLNSLREKSKGKGKAKAKLINWSIYNAGKQTIIVL